MIRTRDFLLFLIMAGFLIVAIGIEFLGHKTPVAFDADDLPDFSEDQLITTTAEVATEADRRAERLENWRDILRRNPPPSDTLATLEGSPTEEPEAEAKEAVEGVKLCPDYREYNGNWPAAGLVITEREGVRIIHQPNELEPVADELGTVHLILPMREYPGLQSACISSDVVGVALDGSLIRNSEAGLYGVLGESTLVGYMLDGLPLYGQSAITTDDCGGVTTPTGYRYYLSADRAEVINCFSAPPTPLS